MRLPMRAKRVVALIASVLLALPLATACSSKGNTPRGSYDSTNDLKSAKSGIWSGALTA